MISVRRAAGDVENEPVMVVVAPEGAEISSSSPEGETRGIVPFEVDDCCVFDGRRRGPHDLQLHGPGSCPEY